MSRQSLLIKMRNSGKPWPTPTMEQPTEEEIDEMIFLDGDCYAIDGCHVEPDGFCPHQMPSWLIYLDLI